MEFQVKHKIKSIFSDTAASSSGKCIGTTFLYCSPYSYRSSTFMITKIVAFNLLASTFVWLLFCFPYSYRSSNYCRSFTLLKVLAKSNGNLIAIAFKSERATTIAIAIVGRAITLERKPSKKKQRTDTKKDVKRIKRDNFTRSNKEKFNILEHSVIKFW